MDEFAKMTLAVISDCGFEKYNPTAIYPARSHINSVVGMGSEVLPEEPLLEWAAQQAGNNEEFLVAFKIDANHFKIIRRIGSYSEDEIYPVT